MRRRLKYFRHKKLDELLGENWGDSVSAGARVRHIADHHQAV